MCLSRWYENRLGVQSNCTRVQTTVIRPWQWTKHQLYYPSSVLIVTCAMAVAGELQSWHTNHYFVPSNLLAYNTTHFGTQTHSCFIQTHSFCSFKPTHFGIQTHSFFCKPTHFSYKTHSFWQTNPLNTYYVI